LGGIIYTLFYRELPKTVEKVKHFSKFEDVPEQTILNDDENMFQQEIKMTNNIFHRLNEDPNNQDLQSLRKLIHSCCRMVAKKRIALENIMPELNNNTHNEFLNKFLKKQYDPEYMVNLNSTPMSLMDTGH